MNIFVLDKNPIKIPSQYCKLHVNKMLLETCQLLCSVYDVGVAPYKRTHYNHPCSKWTRHSIENFTWLEELGNALSSEFTSRTGKTHACDRVLDWIANNTPNLPSEGLTDWPQAMPDEFKGPDTIEAYRRYYEYKLNNFKSRGLIP